jgi:hypothetical protein
MQLGRPGRRGGPARLGGFHDLHCKSAVAKVLHPIRTAAAIRILMHDDHRIVRKRRIAACSQSRGGKESEKRSTCDPIGILYHLFSNAPALIDRFLGSLT